MRALFEEKGAILRVDIMRDKRVQKFIETHADVLSDATSKGIGDREADFAFRQSLENSNYIFSGMKTFHELNEAFPRLTDETGNRKSFRQFVEDVRSIHDTYNKNYLLTEYNFAMASANAARQWVEIERDGDEYLLQYRTMNDDRVRPEHAALEGVTLPPSDSFWDAYYPPNGWNCRCHAVQVRRSKYTATDHEEALRLGQQATAKDTRGIFRFNSGKERKTFPDYNPYTIQRCRDCDIAKGKMKLAQPVDNEVCEACHCVRVLCNENGAEERLERYDENHWERSYLSPKKNGYVVTELERIRESQSSNSERNKYVKEIRMCKILADNGHDIEYLRGENRPKGQTYDIRIDGIKADLKCITGGAGNIVKYIKKALRKQGGEAVVLEIPNQPTVEYYEALAEARRKCNGRILFYIKGEEVLKEVK